MSTTRLYWEDSFAKDFRAKVLRAFGAEGKLHLVLDQTLFYPEGGGQPCDLGYLTLGIAAQAGKGVAAPLRVVNVEETDGEIIHTLDSEGLEADDLVGGEVQGTIDWKRRFGFMQQHTGQHILSRVFEKTFDAQTVGFHLSDTYASIDLDVRSLSQANYERAEDLVNGVVFENLPISAKEYAKDDIPDSLRSRFKSSVDRIRVVHIGDYDACPCGGTHLDFTGQVGLVKLGQVDKAHGGLRVVFRCGVRALQDYREKQRVLDDFSRTFSRAPEEAASAAKVMVQDLQDTKQKLADAQKALLDYEVQSILNREQDNDSPSIVACFEDSPPDRLRYAAGRLSKQSGKLTVVFATHPRFSAVVVSPEGGADARKVTDAISKEWGARGGGAKTMAQTGLREPLLCDGAEIVESMKRMLRQIQGS